MSYLAHTLLAFNPSNIIACVVADMRKICVISTWTSLGSSFAVVDNLIGFLLLLCAYACLGFDQILRLLVEDWSRSFGASMDPLNPLRNAMSRSHRSI